MQKYPILTAFFGCFDRFLAISERHTKTILKSTPDSEGPTQKHVKKSVRRWAKRLTKCRQEGHLVKLPGPYFYPLRTWAVSVQNFTFKHPFTFRRLSSNRNIPP